MQRSLLYCTVLYCTALCCIILYCTVLNYTALHCAMLEGIWSVPSLCGRETVLLYLFSTSTGYLRSRSRIRTDRRTALQARCCPVLDTCPPPLPCLLHRGSSPSTKRRRSSPRSHTQGIPCTVKKCCCL